MIEHQRWQDVDLADWPWSHFTPHEMACRGSGAIAVEPRFMDALETLRWHLGRPLIVTSGYRTPEHNALVSHTKARRGPHTLALAVDVAAPGGQRHEVVEAAMRLGGWTGIGVGASFVHLDRVPPTDPEIPRPNMWGYGEP